MNKTDTKEYPLCVYQEVTVTHFVGQFPAIAQLRGRYFNDYYYLSINKFSITPQFQWKTWDHKLAIRPTY